MGVLTKEQVRESKDEEIVADLLAFMLLAPPPSSRSEFLDDYFGFGEGEASRHRLEEIELAVQKQTIEAVALDFQRVIDELKIVFNRAESTFGQMLFGTQPPRAPRYFQVVFLALHKLLVKGVKEVENYDKLVRLLRGSGGSLRVPEGGRWGAQDRLNSVNSAAGMYAPAFKPANKYDPAHVRWITQLENILAQSYTEQAAYDFKQGLLLLDGSHRIDEDSLEKVLKTLVGIANIKKGTKGYVLVGIADKEGDAKRIQEIYGVAPKVYEKFFITGVEHEAKALDKTLDQLFQLVTRRIKASAISEPLRDYIARNVKLVRYYDKSVFIFESHAQEDPSHFNGEYFVRHGSDLVKIKSENYADLFRRFQVGL